MMTMHCHVVGLKCSRGHVRVHRQKLEQQKEIARRRMWRQEYCKDLYYERHLGTNEAIRCRLRLMFWSRHRGQHCWWRTSRAVHPSRVFTWFELTATSLSLMYDRTDRSSSSSGTTAPADPPLSGEGRRYLKIFVSLKQWPFCFLTNMHIFSGPPALYDEAIRRASRRGGTLGSAFCGRGGGQNLKFHYWAARKSWTRDPTGTQAAKSHIRLHSARTHAGCLCMTSHHRSSHCRRFTQ